MEESSGSAAASSSAAAAAKKSKLVGLGAVGKRIRIFDEGCVVSVDNGGAFMYLFERGDDGRLEPIYLKDQMMELGIIEKEEDMNWKKIRVYDDGLVVSFNKKTGKHTVVLDDDGGERHLVLDDYEEKNNIEWEGHLRGNDDQQLPAVKRIRIPIHGLHPAFVNEDIACKETNFRGRSHLERSFDYIG